MTCTYLATYIDRQGDGVVGGIQQDDTGAAVVLHPLQCVAGFGPGWQGSGNLWHGSWGAWLHTGDDVYYPWTGSVAQVNNPRNTIDGQFTLFQPDGK